MPTNKRWFDTVFYDTIKLIYSSQRIWPKGKISTLVPHTGSRVNCFCEKHISLQQMKTDSSFYRLELTLLPMWRVQAKAVGRSRAIGVTEEIRNVTDANVPRENWQKHGDDSAQKKAWG